MTRSSRDVWTSSFFLSGHSVVSTVRDVRPRLIVAQNPLCCANECMNSASQCVHTQHGSGAVRAPRNAGDKRVKRKRGSRSAAAIAARIERGYRKRPVTAGSTACDQSNQVHNRVTSADGGSHPAVERASTAARDGGDDTFRKRKPHTTGTKPDCDDKEARTARASWSGGHTRDRH